jgi:hypothetical protein
MRTVLAPVLTSSTTPLAAKVCTFASLLFPDKKTPADFALGEINKLDSARQINNLHDRIFLRYKNQ